MHCVELSINFLVIFFDQAVEQAKASPALVVKDPGIVVNKKEEEDLAKGRVLLDKNS